MLQLSFIRQNPELVKERLAIKNFTGTDIVDDIIAADDEKRRLQLESENMQSKANAISKDIGKLMAAKQTDEANKRKQEVESLNNEVKPIRARLAELEKQVDELLVRLPNLPSEKVPPGKTPEDNVTVREGGSMPALAAGALAHWDLAKKFRLIDFDLGNKVTGSGFPFYTGSGAKFQRSLIQYFLDFNTAAGYIEFLPPFMVNEDSAYGTGQLPDKEGQIYGR